MFLVDDVKKCFILGMSYATDHTVNFWVNPPSNPGTQDTLAWFISVVTVTEDTAWGLVPEKQKLVNTLVIYWYIYLQITCLLQIMLKHSPSAKTTVPALTVATRLVAKHSQPPWWSLLRGCSKRDPLDSTTYGERGLGPICQDEHKKVMSGIHQTWPKLQKKQDFFFFLYLAPGYIWSRISNGFTGND